MGRHHHLYDIDSHAEEIVLDESSRIACFGDECTRLTEIESRMLIALMAAEGDTITKERLILAVWGGNAYINDAALKQRIYSLRKKIGRDRIVSVHGIGYRLAP